jgi:PAS domain S-box-containing protein
MAWEYVHPDDRGDALNWFERLGAGETTEPIEYRARHADGSWHWMEAHGNNQLDNPAVEGYVINSRDITARKERQRELEELTSQYQALVDNFPGGGVFLLDKNMCFVRAGGDNLTEVGLNSADFEGNTPHDLYPGEIADEQVHYLERTFDGESHTYRQEFQGSHYELRTMPIRDDMGEVIYAMAVSRNITQLAEQKRELERQNERLEEFVSLISHDLRNPLTVALGRVTVLRQMSNGEAATHLDAIENSLDRMEQITEDTLVLAQKGDSVANMEPVSLPELCRNCWQRVGTVDATLDFEDDIKIKGDTNMLKHIFGNLFRNAIETGGDSAIISIGRTNETKFYVEDNGPGIPVSNRTDVFNSGHTSERDGTGLGLTIVKRLSEAHGWEVVVSDGSDGGARFEFDNVEFVESE